MNLYAYCGNNSLNFTDPTGLLKLSWPWVGDSMVYTIIGPSMDYDDWKVKDLPELGWVTEKGIVGKQWHLGNFFWQYRYGDGSTLNLSHTSLLWKIQDDPQVDKGIKDFEAAVEKIIAAAWKTAMETLDPNKEYDDDDQLISKVYRGSISYNFTKWKYRDDLIALGSGAIQATAAYWVNHNGDFTAHYSYKIRDAFADVLDARNKIPDKYGWRDFDNCNPYWMVASWSDWDDGTVAVDISHPAEGSLPQ